MEWKSAGSAPESVTRRDAGRLAYAIFFVAAGILHFVVPVSYRRIVPPYLCAPAMLVAVSGVAEIAGGVGLLIPRLRQASGLGLMVLLVAVFPANVEMLRQYRAQGVGVWAETLLWLRLPLQGVLLWLAWRLSRPDPVPAMSGSGARAV